MKILNHIHKLLPSGLKSWGMLLVLAFITPLCTQAQIIIEGNVYGGGDMGIVGGSSSVKVISGNIGTDNIENPGGSVFGGARMADVGGSASVYIDGETEGATGYVLINKVYGGNDIAGHIGSSNNYPEGLDVAGAEEEGIDNSWNTFVRISNAKVSAESDKDIKEIYIGQLFGGGNGEYEYTKVEDSETGTITHTIREISTETDEQTHEPIPGTLLTTIVNNESSVKPVAGKSFVDIHGGSIVYAYAGGNNATITENATICVENESQIVGSIKVDEDWQLDDEGTELITDARLTAMGINLLFSSPTAQSDEDFQIGRLFGGNNLAEMNIRPTWYLETGSIRNLYSGGNRGDMTYVEGLLLEIPYESDIRIDNLFGGCRMANVNPLKPGTRTPAELSEIQLTDKNTDGTPKYKFPAGMSARVLLHGGNVNNVYGGNDISGKVTGGNALGIYTSVRGNIYGGGNGSYAYTDNDLLKDDLAYGDVYYKPAEVLANNDVTAKTGFESVTALNLFRPDAEQVSLLLSGNPVLNENTGEVEFEKTVIGGSVFLGGNSATIRTSNKISNPIVELKIGTNVIADQVFLGNNGENMIKTDQANAALGVKEGILRTMASKLSSDDSKFNTIALTDSSQFAKYMDGATMDLIPSISFTSLAQSDRYDYDQYSSYIGSLYFGGNVGSMAYPGINEMNLTAPFIIFNKLVAGCNKASVPKTPFNAYYDGGILGDTTVSDYTGDRIVMTLNGPKIEPKRWNDVFTKLFDGTVLTQGKKYYTSNLRSTEFVSNGQETVNYAKHTYYYDLTTPGTELVWNTAIWNDETDDDYIVPDEYSASIQDDLRLLGGNVFGGCYNSGHVNGNVKINIESDLIVRNEVFDQTDNGGNANSNVILEKQGEDIMVVAMAVFGAGMGKQTEVWGNTNVNLKNAYAFQIFGGGELGVVGKGDIQKDNNDQMVTDEYGYPQKDYAYNPLYSTTVNLRGSYAGYSEDEEGPVLAESEYLYGAGNEGDVCGNSYVYLGNGRIYDVFGGASNANILGHSEIYIGKQKDEAGNDVSGFPWIRDIVFGGNDFGGKIGNNGDFSTVPSIAIRISENAISEPNMLSEVSTYVSYIQGRVDTIFGGNYGNYDYYDDVYNDYVYTYSDNQEEKLGKPKGDFSYPYLNGTSLVYFQPADNNKNHVGYILGGSEGFPGIVDVNNTMQEKAYVIIDDVNTSADNKDIYRNTDIYGGGAFAGVGSIEVTLNSDTILHPGAGRTVVDLLAGRFNEAFGGCVNEGMVGFTRVNVPPVSTIHLQSIYGGGKGYSDDVLTAAASNSTLYAKLKAAFCDHYITCVDYKSENAIVDGAVYGGNNNRRIACDTYLNIGTPVKNSAGQLITVYGAGYGAETVTTRTNVFLQDGAEVNQVYGGGRNGNVFNYLSMIRWLAQQYSTTDGAVITQKLAEYSSYLDAFNEYIAGRQATNQKPEWAAHPIDLPADVLSQIGGAYQDNTRDFTGSAYYNTNVHILAGGKVLGNPRADGKGTSNGYAYAGGLGSDAVVAGSTYIELKGGYVEKDIYAGGEGGPVMNEYSLTDDISGDYKFIASANAYIEGGTVRNVYGGGYNGHVGKHTKIVENQEVPALISEDYANDVPGETNVVIGKIGGTSYTDGIPAIGRNIYAGGEGGSVYGTTHLTINNGYIGYLYDPDASDDPSTLDFDERYVANLKEYETDNNNRLTGHGNAFGGGYVASSYVDISDIEMYGGTLRGSLYGGGEIGPIGRGTKLDVTKPDFAIRNGDATIYKAGQTHVKMFNGHVLRNVFGGGRGRDSWGGEGWKPEEETDLSSKGNVFGQTDVCIYGGEIGTEKGVLAGEEIGNVFGGCDLGYVYSAYELADGTLGYGKKPDNSVRYDDDKEGYYYKYEGDGFKTDTQTGEYLLTEDCHVLVEPWLEVIDPNGIEYDSKTYAKGSYIPTAYLNTLGKKNKTTGVWEDAEEWAQVDVGYLIEDTENPENNKFIERGVIIHNAVFAGGNVTPGSESFANTPTVLGNATASIHDIYSRDLITIGTGHTGGLYGDGNLTLVDGYRGLNITNYGTDYYNIPDNISYAEYKKLPPREQNYYELKFICTNSITDNEETTYQAGAQITQDELITLFTGVNVGDNPIIENGQLTDAGRAYWTENGVVSLYAGRIMNTIQRADFCGVFGSRMVMKGARDRTIETMDLTKYTINRVREVSLNKKGNNGNYFGIYSIVNHLGALTSDVDMNDIRKTDNTKDGYKDSNYETSSGTGTYYGWKEQHLKDRKGNDGSSHNKVALASGVYLELTTEKSTGTGLYEKDWGYITGVVELDLINVSTGVGGGFVYAKNVHGQRQPSGKRNTIIEGLNTGAATNKSWIYIDKVQIENTENYNNIQAKMETSGNFVHSEQTIIDDCYNISGKYNVDNDPVPAHYWFIKGQVYVYDQIISAYTGSAKAYPSSSEIPLTINAGAYGKMKLINVQPNRYAYYSSYSSPTNNVKLTGDNKLAIKDMTFNLNDPITYWDWKLLTPAEQKLFVDDTYVVLDSCKITKNDDEEVEYSAGSVLLPEEYNALKNDEKTTVIFKKSADGLRKDTVDFTYAVRSSNNIGHNTGYLLTYDVNNPAIWDKWYIPVTGGASNKISTTSYDQLSDKSGYLTGPTYKPDVSNIYGQRSYQAGEIITLQEYIDYEGEDEDLNGNGILEKGLKGNEQYASLLNALNSWTEQSQGPDTRQAEFARAWIATEPIMTDDKNGVSRQLQKGARLVESDFNPTQWAAIQDKVALAYVSTRPIQISATEIITDHQTMTLAEKETYMGSTSASNLSAINTLLNNITDITEERKKAIIDGAALTTTEQEALGEEGISSLNSLLFTHSIDQSVVPAYYCTNSGLYGGDYYDKDKNYRAIYAWSSMSEADRAHFNFNYDALDLLIDPNYRNDAITSGKDDGKKYQYDGSQYEVAEPNPNDKDKLIYSMQKPVDYTATYEGTDANAASVFFTPDGSNEPTSIATAGRTELTRTEFESILNEQINYAPIAVKDAGHYYVVKNDFFDVHPYVVGQVIDEAEYENLTSNTYVNNKNNVDILYFDAVGTYYYCCNAYDISTANGGHAVIGIQAAPNTTINNSAILAGTVQTVSVPQGFIISQEGNGANNSYQYGYMSLTNQQKDFSIHGTIPVETSTLYVSRNSDIYDLSKEKIITLIYQYDYNDFIDETGMNILPVSEYHVINIHLQFESGIPMIDDITDPATVLPGTSLTMTEPAVTPGAYEVFGGGWEIFKNETDAVMGINGAEYTPNSDLLYWYQNGYYIAYYAKTYLGKTYSNPKPLSVANYHDLKNIMDDNIHHLYVDYDNRQLDRNSKVYINDYSSSGKNGLDLFKDFFDLSVYSSTLNAEDLDNDGLITSARFEGHAPLNADPKYGVIGGNNLDFFLHTNVNYTDVWTPIGSNEGDPCFSGVFNGDGYTISGLSQSLFHSLCGDVYNLGVTGSFTGAGIADLGDGYIENSWVKSSATAGWVEGVQAVFGNPDRSQYVAVPSGTKLTVGQTYYTSNSGDGQFTAESELTSDGTYYTERPLIQIVNCYYPVGNEYTVTENQVHGAAIQKPVQSFYNGEVAYDLNSSYLNKRYYDGSGVSTANHDAKYGDLDYVALRYADGDYRFVGQNGGVIPTTPDLLREYQENEDAPVEYRPVWPDDYLFFGQNLTFGWDEDRPHQDLPSHYNGSNRVLRAPAYYGDNVMSTIHFNPDANLAAYTKDKTHIAYPNLTAIDFAGHNDVSGGYMLGARDGKFYGPILDLGLNNDGLTSISNRDETRNLLVYAPATQYDVTVTTTNDNDEPVTTTQTVNSNTYSVLKAYFMDTDGDYADYHAENDDYRRVLKVENLDIRGHLVQSDLTATHDHLLVDKQDFNAPISYEFTGDHYMWYQRKPDSYVNSQTSGWETVSLPFTVELVTTHQKGELTHFYDYKVNNISQQNVGHEYWLREFRELENANNSSPIVETVENETTVTNIYFSSLKGRSNSSKTTHNTFLWDYYYNNENNSNTDDRHKDKNKDEYQTYYNFGPNGKTYPSYPFQTAGMPYLIGWPGSRYYEFDLSGNFVPQNTAATGPAALDELGQMITFVSNKNVSIDVTQNEYDDFATTISGFTFTPNYQTRTLPGTTTYLLNAAGDAFQNNTESAQTTVPFRAYLTKTTASGAPRRNAKIVDADVLYIAYMNNPDYLEGKASQGGLRIYAKDMSIIVESTLPEPATVTITTAAGAPLESFTIQPAAKVITPINNRGVYIVNNLKIVVAR